MKNWKVLFLGLMVSGISFSGGFEKSVLWSGEQGGKAGAAVSSVDNSEALFFNPAGLAAVEGGNVSVNFSPIFSKFKAPVIPGSGEDESEQGFSPVFGVTAAYSLGHNLVVGLGSFVSGGVNTTYKDDSYPEDIVGKLTLVDFALGLGYQISEHFSVGLSWKATMAKAELSSYVHGPVGPVPAGVLTVKDLDKWNYAGLRFGAQYVVPNKYGMGFSVRTPITLEMEGKTETTDPLLGAADSTSKLKSTLPLQVAVGAHFNATSAWRLYTQIDWTNYGKNKDLELSTSTAHAVPALGTYTGIRLDWNDQIVVRLATEYDLNDTWTLRGGYALTTQVTNEDKAKPTFSTPGIAHTLDLGIGAEFGSFETNLALDYNFAKSEGGDNTFEAIGGATSGDYSVNAYGAHLGVAYNF